MCAHLCVKSMLACIEESYSLYLHFCTFFFVQARKKYKHGMFCINAKDEKRERKKSVQVQKLSPSPLLYLSSSSL